MQKQIGSGIKFADWAVVVLAGVLFIRTADVLAYFSPSILNEIIGSDVSWIYGIVCAFFIEGVAIAYHFHPGARRHTPAVIAKWTLLVLSAICQVFDGRIITGTLAEMPEAQKLAFQIGVPLLPLFVLVLLFFVGEIPESASKRRGLRSYIPNWKNLWEGDEDTQENTVFSTISASEVVQTELDNIQLQKSPNGKGKETVNPTMRQP